MDPGDRKARVKALQRGIRDGQADWSSSKNTSEDNRADISGFLGERYLELASLTSGDTRKSNLGAARGWLLKQKDHAKKCRHRAKRLKEASLAVGKVCFQQSKHFGHGVPRFLQEAVENFREANERAELAKDVFSQHQALLSLGECLQLQAEAHANQATPSAARTVTGHHLIQQAIRYFRQAVEKATELAVVRSELRWTEAEQDLVNREPGNTQLWLARCYRTCFAKFRPCRHYLRSALSQLSEAVESTDAGSHGRLYWQIRCEQMDVGLALGDISAAREYKRSVPKAFRSYRALAQYAEVLGKFEHAYKLYQRADMKKEEQRCDAIWRTRRDMEREGPAEASALQDILVKLSDLRDWASVRTLGVKWILADSTAQRSPRWLLLLALAFWHTGGDEEALIYFKEASQAFLRVGRCLEASEAQERVASLLEDRGELAQSVQAYKLAFHFCSLAQEETGSRKTTQARERPAVLMATLAYHIVLVARRCTDEYHTIQWAAMVLQEHGLCLDQSELEASGDDGDSEDDDEAEDEGDEGEEEEQEREEAPRALRRKRLVSANDRHQASKKARTSLSSEEGDIRTTRSEAVVTSASDVAMDEGLEIHSEDDSAWRSKQREGLDIIASSDVDGGDCSAEQRCSFEDKENLPMGDRITGQTRSSVGNSACRASMASDSSRRRASKRHVHIDSDEEDSKQGPGMELLPQSERAFSEAVSSLIGSAYLPTRMRDRVNTKLRTLRQMWRTNAVQLRVDWSEVDHDSVGELQRRPLLANVLQLFKEIGHLYYLGGAYQSAWYYLATVDNAFSHLHVPSDEISPDLADCLHKLQALPLTPNSKETPQQLAWERWTDLLMSMSTEDSEMYTIRDKLSMAQMQALKLRIRAGQIDASIKNSHRVLFGDSSKYDAWSRLPQLPRSEVEVAQAVEMELRKTVKRIRLSMEKASKILTKKPTTTKTTQFRHDCMVWTQQGYLAVGLYHHFVSQIYRERNPDESRGMAEEAKRCYEECERLFRSFEWDGDTSDVSGSRSPASLRLLLRSAQLSAKASKRQATLWMIRKQWNQAIACLNKTMKDVVAFLNAVDEKFGLHVDDPDLQASKRGLWSLRDRAFLLGLECLRRQGRHEEALEFLRESEIYSSAAELEDDGLHIDRLSQEAIACAWNMFRQQKRRLGGGFGDDSKEKASKWYYKMVLSMTGDAPPEDEEREGMSEEETIQARPDDPDADV